MTEVHNLSLGLAQSSPSLPLCGGRNLLKKHFRPHVDFLSGFGNIEAVSLSLSLSLLLFSFSLSLFPFISLLSLSLSLCLSLSLSLYSLSLYISLLSLYSLSLSFYSLSFSLSLSILVFGGVVGFLAPLLFNRGFEGRDPIHFWRCFRLHRAFVTNSTVLFVGLFSS